MGKKTKAQEKASHEPRHTISTPSSEERGAPLTRESCVGDDALTGLPVVP